MERSAFHNGTQIAFYLFTIIVIFTESDRLWHCDVLCTVCVGVDKRRVQSASRPSTAGDPVKPAAAVRFTDMPVSSSRRCSRATKSSPH